MKLRKSVTRDDYGIYRSPADFAAAFCRDQSIDRWVIVGHFPAAFPPALFPVVGTGVYDLRGGYPVRRYTRLYRYALDHRVPGSPVSRPFPVAGIGGPAALRLSAACYLLILLLTFQGDPLNARLLTALFSAAIFIFAVYTLSKLDTTPSLPVRILKVLFTMHGVLMMSQALVIGMDWLGLNQANTGFVLQLILVNHILLATATTLALPLLAFTHSEQRLRVMAERDGLTGLYNRRSLFREGIRAFDQATQSQTQLAVLMLDLDHFKQVNDRWGHAAGDDALRLVARTLKNELRDDDIIGRVGGEEFAMVLRITGDDDVRIITRRLLDTIATNGQEIDGLPLYISASIGGVEKAGHHKTFADMMIEADAALYNAKDKGRNRAEFGRLTPETSVS